MSILGAALLGNILSGILNKGSGIVRAGDGILKKSLILPKPHPLTNFEIMNCYKNEPRFNGVFQEITYQTE